MATVKPGIYLEDNPPARSQFRRGRRQSLKPIIVVHTAEGGTDTVGPDAKAENVANFIKNRSTAGSYHLLGDRDSIIQLVDFDNEAYGDGTGSNKFAVHISLSMNSADWNKLSRVHRDQYIDTAAQMAAIAAKHMERQGLRAPAARLLTKPESDAAAGSGFISHGRRDPGRRSDPGRDFPWNAFFTAYNRYMGATAAPSEPTTTPLVNQTHAKDLQNALGVPQTGVWDEETAVAARRRWLGYRAEYGTEVAGLIENDPVLVEWAQRCLNERDNAQLLVDGNFGPKTRDALINYTGRRILDLGIYKWMIS